MGTMGRASEDDKAKKKPVEQLQKEYDAIKRDIDRLTAEKKDKQELSPQDKAKFRELYTKKVSLAEQIAEQSTDGELARFCREAAKKAREDAVYYGSAMREIPKTTLDDVKGLTNIKKLIKNFIYLAQHRSIADYYRVDSGLGVLMYGAPGTGKTMFAEAIANAMNLPLFVVTPSDIFKSYVGESEQAVKSLFQELEACEDGAVLFIDECESIFSSRTGDTKDYKSAVTTELLQRMNGFGDKKGRRIMIAATNRPDKIDEAYLRYKRFTYLFYIPLPDAEAVEAIIKKRVNGIELSPDDGFGIKYMCTRLVSPGLYYSAADICGIIEKTCMKAVEEMALTESENAKPLTKEMFDAALHESPCVLNAESMRIFTDFENKNTF